MAGSGSSVMEACITGKVVNEISNAQMAEDEWQLEDDAMAIPEDNDRSLQW